MAIGLQNTDNTDAPDVAYPFGKVRDDDGSGNGTPANTKTLGDFHQFFAKLLSLVGVTPNNTPDNNTNGFQYADALVKLIENPTWITGLGNLTFQNSWSWAGIEFKKNLKGTVSFKGQISHGASAQSGASCFVLPVGYRPSTERNISATIVNTDSVTRNNGILKIETDGTVTIFETGVNTGGFLSGSPQFYVFFDNVEFYL